MKRTTFRINQAVHIAAGFYNLAFVYTPLHEWRYGLGIVQWVSLPLLVVTGSLLLRIPRRRIHFHGNNAEAEAVSLARGRNDGARGGDAVERVRPTLLAAVQQTARGGVSRDPPNPEGQRS